jgi:hypothetical protein
MNKKCMYCGVVFISLVMINNYGHFICKECHIEHVQHNLEKAVEINNFPSILVSDSATTSATSIKSNPL